MWAARVKGSPGPARRGGKQRGHKGANILNGTACLPGGPHACSVGRGGAPWQGVVQTTRESWGRRPAVGSWELEASSGRDARGLSLAFIKHVGSMRMCCEGGPAL